MISDPLIRYRRPLIVGVHLILAPLGYLIAFALRFDSAIPAAYLQLFWSTLPLLLAVRLASFGVFGLYSGWWRHSGMQDLIDLFRAVTVSSAAFLAALFMTRYLDGFPRSILVLDWLNAILLFGGARFVVRGVREGRITWKGSAYGTPVIIVGAGEAAERLLRQLRPNGGNNLVPVGLIDDDPRKAGMRLHGVPVMGTIDDLPDLVFRHNVKLIVIAIPSATREEMQRIVEQCMETGVEFKIVPSLREMLDGRVRLHELRNVQIEDLLGRDAIELDLADLRRDIAGKIVLITGGAGSIGSELARQIAGFGPARLILFEQAESPLYFTHLEITQAWPELDIVPIVGDVTDEASVQRTFADYRPNYVFHAAAYKHVPLMEINVAEAVRNNVFGTLCVAQAAARHRAEKFVLISTDKAVHPSSVMGATKRIAEQIVLGWPSLRMSRTEFRAVRFGNVLGSEGSVVPLFKRQLAAGGPLTVTHPEVTRYFMTIPEAVQLVLQASTLEEAAGRIAMLEMGEPVRITELAENLIRLSGLEPYRDIQIVFSGLRPGEKLHEELMSAVEATVPTEVDKIRVVQTGDSTALSVTGGVDRLAAALALDDTDSILTAICELVPECSPPLRDRGLSVARSERVRQGA